MNNYWSRNDTKEWIVQLEHRIDDIEYYLDRTLKWCEEYGVDDERVIFLCSFLTCVWVSTMRGEPITFIELMEILGVEGLHQDEEKIYELSGTWAELDHIELLEKALEKFQDGSIEP